MFSGEGGSLITVRVQVRDMPRSVRQICPISLIAGAQLDTLKIAKLLDLIEKDEPENRSVGGSIPPLGTTPLFAVVL